MLQKFLRWFLREKRTEYDSNTNYSNDVGLVRTKEDLARTAKALDCEVVVAGDGELFIDIDTEYQFETFKKNIALFSSWFKHRGWVESESKQGLPHRHIIVTLKDHMPLLNRIALQACLGSDPTRELISMKKVLDGEKGNVNVFFEKKKHIRMIEI